MKSKKIIICLASLALLASCGGNSSSASASASGLSVSSSSAAKKTMDFLKDGQFYLDVPSSVLVRDGEQATPVIRLNGMAVEGARTYDLGGKFELSAEGTFAKDLYLTIAKSEQEGNIAVKLYGPINKAVVNEALITVNVGVGVPNKVFVSFSTEKATWPHGHDAQMDQEIASAWQAYGE